MLKEKIIFAEDFMDAFYAMMKPREELNKLWMILMILDSLVMK